jgi:group I intron endonuclease
MNKISGIYGIFNKINGKVYVGSSINLNNRHNQHFNYLKYNRHYNAYLQAAWNKYGEENFEFVILEKIKYPTKKKLEKREQYWINYCDSANPEKGYNLYPTAGSPLGKHLKQIKNNQKLF